MTNKNPRKRLFTSLIFLLATFLCLNIVKTRMLSEDENYKAQKTKDNGMTNTPNYEKQNTIKDYFDEFDHETNVNVFVERVPRPQGVLTYDFYKENDPIQFSCVEHVKMLEIGFTCEDGPSIDLDDKGVVEPDDIKGVFFQSFYVVTKNSRKYFMKVLKDMYTIEHYLEDKFYNDDIGLTLVEYKIVKHRFVGIYAYYPHNNTLMYHLKEGNLNMFQKLFIMAKITKFASIIFEEVEPQNNMIKVNFFPSNLLITKEGYLNIRLINICRVTKEEKMYIKLPEYQDRQDEKKINQRLSTVYVLSRTFYQIIFNEDNGENDFDDLEKVKEFRAQYKASTSRSKEDDILSDLVDLMRSMSNSNPVDRPSIEYVLNTIQDKMDRVLNWQEKINIKWEIVKTKMKDEVDDEMAAHEDRVRLQARKKALKKLEMKNDDWAKKDEIYQNQLKEYQEKQIIMYEFKGWSENCPAKDPENLLNILDSFGYIPNFITFNGSEEEDSDQALNHESHHKKADKEKNELKDNHSDHGAHGDHGDHEHHEDLTELRVEFILLIAFLLLLAGLVSSYFVFKNLDIKMYEIEQFPTHIELE